ALDPAELGRLNVERPAAGTGQLVDADLELALIGPKRERIQGKRDGERDEREDRPEEPASRHRPDGQAGRDEHHRDAGLQHVPASTSIMTQQDAAYGLPERARNLEID